MNQFEPGSVWVDDEGEIRVIKEWYDIGLGFARVRWYKLGEKRLDDRHRMSEFRSSEYAAAFFGQRIMLHDAASMPPVSSEVAARSLALAKGKGQMGLLPAAAEFVSPFRNRDALCAIATDRAALGREVSVRDLEEFIARLDAHLGGAR